MPHCSDNARAGILIAKAAADTVKRVHTELGGKAANLVLEGADLAAVLPPTIAGVIANSGQSCIAPTRILVHQSHYQEAIVRSIRNARAVALIFSKAANNSDEIKKELSLASRYRVPVMALRIEDVEPSDAFAYELSTRQWIDAFESWDRSIDSLVRRIGQLPGAQPAATEDVSARRRSTFSSRRTVATAALAGMLLLVVAAGA